MHSNITQSTKIFLKSKKRKKKKKRKIKINYKIK